MGKTLTIDQGNSRAKIAIWNGQDLIHTNIFDSFSHSDLTQLLQQHPVDTAIYSSVAHRSDYIAQILAQAHIPALQLKPGVPSPLKIDYKTPSTLGVDRIAAAVGALALFPDRDLLVVDAGTAVTYDRVTSRGHFAGGNIAPGVGMRLRALNSFTARLPLVSSRGETQLWGTSTETAMRSGAINGVVAEISYYRSRLPKDAIIVISGGWGKEISQKLDFETHYDPLLVNRGLNAILTYNQLISSILSHNETD